MMTIEVNEARKALATLRKTAPGMLASFVQDINKLTVDERIELLAHMILSFQNSIRPEAFEEGADGEYWTEQ